jgi:hypothetical protein
MWARFTYIYIEFTASLLPLLLFNRKNNIKSVSSIPVISVVSNTMNELVAVLEDVTQHGHHSNYQKDSEEN